MKSRQPFFKSLSLLQLVVACALTAFAWGPVAQAHPVDSDVHAPLNLFGADIGLASNDFDNRGISMKLEAITKIRCDGEMIQPGAVFESDDQGLIDCGAARLAGDLDTEIDEALATSTGGADDIHNPSDEGQDARLMAINEALTGMVLEDQEKTNDTLWTKDGKPRVKAVLNRAGVEATAEEIVAEWDRFVEGKVSTRPDDGEYGEQVADLPNDGGGDDVA